MGCLTVHVIRWAHLTERKGNTASRKPMLSWQMEPGLLLWGQLSFDIRKESAAPGLLGCNPQISIYEGNPRLVIETQVIVGLYLGMKDKPWPGCPQLAWPHPISDTNRVKPLLALDGRPPRESMVATLRQPMANPLYTCLALKTL